MYNPTITSSGNTNPIITVEISDIINCKLVHDDRMASIVVMHGVVPPPNTRIDLTDRKYMGSSRVFNTYASNQRHPLFIANNTALCVQHSHNILTGVHYNECSAINKK